VVCAEFEASPLLTGTEAKLRTVCAVVQKHTSGVGAAGAGFLNIKAWS